jgi:hypothetical protein
MIVFQRRLPKLAVWVLALAGCAAPMTQTPRVVWQSGDRAYVALRDSTSLTAGDRVRFQLGDQTVAAGTVAQVVRGEMAQVELTSGSLGGERELAKVGVVVERAPFVPPSVLRIGLPSSARGTPFFKCRHVGVQPQWPDHAYETYSPSSRVTRFIRNPATAAETHWPDTLLVRLYDEVADEEIAIERGELDVAVFWPGELSSHMRASPRWGNPLMGIRSPGKVALVWSDTSSVDPFSVQREKFSVFAALNRDLFHGDLLSLPAGVTMDSAGVTIVRPRFQVDPILPGRAELQRYIDQHEPAPWSGFVRIQYSTLFTSPSGIFSGEGVTGTYLYAIRCPIVCRPGLRAYLAALGADQLANLIDCSP